MSSSKSTSQKALDHILKKLGYIALFCFVVFATWKLGNIWIERVVNTQQEQVSQTIINTINEQANLNLLLPEIVFINIDTTAKKQLTDSLKSEIVSVLSKKYLSNEKVNLKETSLQPFYIFPETADSLGYYKLTKAQLVDLKNHIVFLTNQVDKAVEQTKDEINKEIARINTWVSIWIGVLSIFGTIIPLFYNYKNNEDLKNIKEAAGEAKDKSEKAHNLIETHREDLVKVKEVSKDLATIKTDFDGFKNEVITAKVSSKEALGTANIASAKASKVEKLVTTLNDVSKLKDLDASFLLYNNKPFETLKSYLLEIHTNLSNCSDLCNDPIIKDVLRQLSLRIYLLSISGFIKNPNIFELLNQFALELSERIGQPFTAESYNEAIGLLNTLNVNLDIENTLS